MIKAESIVKQLQVNLPFQTDLFSEKVLSVTTLAPSGLTVTATTSAAHGLTTGENVIIKGADTVIDIVSITFTPNVGITATGGTVTVVTTTNHDFTENNKQTITIEDADQSDYNGTFDVIKAPNRLTVTYEITANPVTPATGTPKVLYTYAPPSGGFNGLYPIVVTGASEFTYTITQVGLTENARGTITATNGTRIARAVSIERAVGAYTAQQADALWGFVVLGDTVTSKDRHIATDAQHTYGPGDTFRSRVIVPFSIVVIFPTTGAIDGGEARDSVEDIKKVLFKSLLRTRLPSILTETSIYATTYSGDFFFGYQDAYYIHRIDFETVVDITLEDTVDFYSVAFRDVDMIFKDPLVTDGDDIIMQTLDISLDDVPL